MNLENNNFSKNFEISTQTNIFCSGAFVVDGGRAVLPYPEGSTDLTISQRDYNIAWTLNDKDNLEDYLTRSGI